MAKATKVKGSAIYDAVLMRAKNELFTYQQYAEEAHMAAQRAQEARDDASAARERYEECVNFLNEHFPGWQDTLTDEDREKFGV